MGVLSGFVSVIGASLLNLVRRIGAGVLNAWAPILRSEGAHLYVDCKTIFIAAVAHADDAVNATEYPDFWDRMQARIKAAYNYASPLLQKALADEGAEIGAGAKITAINAAYTAVRGGEFTDAQIAEIRAAFAKASPPVIAIVPPVPATQ